ncbi:TRAP transporter large permease [Brachybacterium paraconglomeratum]|uniref:TRAP transporter large permease n=1 Tax=Brachybacterium paraconglomeratum TaxID=173362 RepID=UPI003FD3991E
MSSSLIIVMIVFLVLLFLRVPVFLSILAGCLTYFLMNPEVPGLIAAQRLSSGVQSVPLLAIPFFVAAGTFMNYTGISRRVMNFAAVVTGRMRGGLAQVNVLMSTMMGGLSGSNLADAAMTSKMLVPEMRRKGYSNAFSSVVTATSAMITPLIPPGIAMILYGSIANVSIGRLFVSGLSIGLLLTVALMILVWLISRRHGYAPLRTEKVKPREFGRAAQAASLALLLPVIIIGAIRLGIFTPTEAGAAAILYALLLGIAYRELSLRNFLRGVKETVVSTSSIMVIVGAASVLAWIFTREQLPQALTESISSVIASPWTFLIVMNLFLLVVGMFMEGNAAMIILVPLLAPMAELYGIDEIHFAMIFIFNMAIGSLSPPVGTLMLVTAGITKVKIAAFIREAVPFYITLIVVLALVTFVPAITTAPVSLVYGGN